LLLTCLLLITVLASYRAAAQASLFPQPCGPPATQDACAPGLNLAPGTFTATPFVDAQQINGQWPDWGDPDHNIVSLYGVYGNDESLQSSFQAVRHHYQKGLDLADEILPRCRNGSLPSGDLCQDGEVFYPPAIVFLFIGFSNCDIEVCGGNSDAWDGQYNPPNGHLAGQPCSTQCPNLHNPDPDHPNP
jgi:hypothetical protein